PSVSLAGFPGLLILIFDLLAGTGFDNCERRANNLLTQFKNCDLLFPITIFVADGHKVLALFREEQKQGGRTDQNGRSDGSPDPTTGLLTVFNVNDLLVRDCVNLASLVELVFKPQFIFIAGAEHTFNGFFDSGEILVFGCASLISGFFAVQPGQGGDVQGKREDQAKGDNLFHWDVSIVCSVRITS